MIAESVSPVNPPGRAKYASISARLARLVPCIMAGERRRAVYAAFISRERARRSAVRLPIM